MIGTGRSAVWLVLTGLLALPGAGRAAEKPADAVRFRKVSCVDTQGIGSEAFSMLVPSDWRFQGGIRWVLDNPGMPAVAAFTVTSPSGTEELEVFPNQAFFWTSNPMLLSMFPVGSRYFGAEVRPPMGPLEALENVVLPRFRGRAGNLQVVGKQPLPELARSLGAGAVSQPGVASSASGGKVRVQYVQNGRSMEEEIYCVVESVSFPIQTLTGPVTNTLWTVGYIFSFKAPRGKLDAASKLFQTMIFSFKLDPRWFSRYSQVVQYLIQAQIRQIQNIGQLSRIISQTSNEISDGMMDSYNQRQKVYDNISENFSRHIRGVDAYHDPIAGKTVELPSGYRNAWASPLGEYVLSDDPGFNPNAGSSRNWQRIEVQR